MDDEEAELDIDLFFGARKPTFGDLFTLTGDDHPKFPASGHFDFAGLAALGYEQIDDFFGVFDQGIDADEDVMLWLYPLVRGQPVFHDPGPFDGVRLSCRRPSEGDRRMLLLEGSVAVLCPFCDRAMVGGSTVAQGSPLDPKAVTDRIADLARRRARSG